MLCLWDACTFSDLVICHLYILNLTQLPGHVELMTCTQSSLWNTLILLADISTRISLSSVLSVKMMSIISKI